MRKQRIDGIDSERDVEWDEVLQFRANALLLIDEYQLVLRYNELTTIQQNELAAYRIALLDCTTQSTANAAADSFFSLIPNWME